MDEMSEYKPSPDREMFRWGPIDSMFISLYFPASSVTQYFFDEYEYVWPQGYMLSNGKQWLWTNDMESLNRFGLKCFKDLILNASERLRIRNNYVKTAEELKSYANHLVLHSFDDFTNSDFIQQFQKWNEKYHLFWAHATAPELSTWGAEDYLRKQIQKLGFSRLEIVEIMEALTVPTDLSFFQKAELDLVERMSSIKEDTPENREIVFNEYVLDWYYLNNSYSGVSEFTVDEAKATLEHLIKKNGTVEAAVLSLRSYKDQLAEKRYMIQKKYHLPEDLMVQSVALGNCISWQDERKGEVWRQMEVLVLFMNEFEKRFGVLVENSQWISSEELLRLYKTPEIISDLALQRRSGCVVFISKDGSEVLIEEQAKKVFDELWELKHGTNQLQGIVASFGAESDIVVGIARIIYSPNEAGKFNAGEILVSPMTTPDYMPLIRKAKAIVTDEGGLTAHAAVVARELGIPCIVGTKFATQKIQSGDRIELVLHSGEIIIL